MKRHYVKLFLLAVLVGAFIADASAQTRRRSSTRRTQPRTQANVTAPTPDTVAVVAAPPPPPPPPPPNDSLPIKPRKKSLRDDFAAIPVDRSEEGENILPYEHLRKDDAVYKHRIWREIDAREKVNTPFRYKVEEDDGDQRFISILLHAIEDSLISVFSANDDRFTTPYTKADVVKAVSGDTVEVPLYDENGELTGTKKMLNEVNLDSFYKFRIKEEVIFDKESSRLWWRIIGIAPIKNIITSTGLNLGESELFWIYYPDLRPVLAKHYAFNGKNFGARVTWEQIFESRMFYGRIVKTTLDNPYDLLIKDYKSLSENGILQLLEGENIKETIFNYEQDVWSY